MGLHLAVGSRRCNRKDERLARLSGSYGQVRCTEAHWLIHVPTRTVRTVSGHLCCMGTEPLLLRCQTARDLARQLPVRMVKPALP